MLETIKGLQEKFADHDNFTRFIFCSFLVFRLQVQVLHYHSAVVLEKARNFSNLTLLTACNDLHCIPNPNMHLVQHRKTVRFTLLSLPSLKLWWKRKENIRTLDNRQQGEKVRFICSKKKKSTRQ
jgi:hypothetical protein